MLNAIRPTTLATSIAAFTVLASSASHAQELPEPCFWAYAYPKGDAIMHPNIIGILNVPTHIDGVGPNDPADAAELAKWLYDNRPRGRENDPVCLILRKIGTGEGDPLDFPRVWSPPLFRSWCDSLPDIENPNSLDPEGCVFPPTGEIVTKWFYAPWMTHGLMVTRAYVDSFIEEYKALQNAHSSTLPDPVRFHFDSENRPKAANNNGVDAFLACMNDPYDRHITEPIPGFGVSLAALYEQQGFDQGIPNPDLAWHKPENQPFVNWYAGVIRRACDAAMNEAVYEPLREAFPGALCSNYGSSIHVKEPYVFRPRRRYGSEEWCGLRWTGEQDIQAPVLYPVVDDHLRENEDTHDATMRVHTENVDHMVMSLPAGRSAREIMPWVINIGEFIETWGFDEPYIITKHDFTELIAMLRSRDIVEYMLWDFGNLSEDSWNQAAEAIDQVWRWDVDSLEVSQGVAFSLGEESLDHALDGNHLVIRTQNNGIAQKATLKTTFVTEQEPQQSDYQIRFEFEVGNTSVPNILTTWTVSMLDYGGVEPEWVQIGGEITPIPNTDGRQTIIVDVSPQPGQRFFKENFTSKVRFKMNTLLADPFNVVVDLVQLIEIDNEEHNSPTPMGSHTEWDGVDWMPLPLPGE